MLGEGLEALIPSKKNDPPSSRAGGEEEIEFPLPDITNIKGMASPVVNVLSQPIPTQITQTERSNHGASKGENIFNIEVERIHSNPHQPRRDFNDDNLNELASSIREFGILQPLVGSKIEIETPTGSRVEYELIAGERRLMAAKKLGLPTVPVIIRQTQTGVEKLELAIVENIQREDLNAIESARAMARLQDEFGLTQREIAVRLGKSRESVSNTMRLLNLPSDIQKAIEEGRINEGQGRAFLSVNDSQLREALFRDALVQGLSVRELEARIRRIQGGAMSNKRPSIILDPESMALKDQLEEILGTRVDMKRDGKSGKIIINFYSQEELDALISKFIKRNDDQQTSPLLET